MRLTDHPRDYFAAGPLGTDPNWTGGSPWWEPFLYAAPVVGGAALAGALSGGGAAGTSGAAAAGTNGMPAASAGVLPSTAIGNGMIGPIAGGNGMASGGGFWSSLGKFVGGDQFSKMTNAIDTVGRLAGGASQGRAAGRVQEAGIHQNQDLLKMQAARLLEDALFGRANLDLQQRQYALNAPQQRASNAARGDVLANAQDAQIRGPIVHTRGQVPQLTGGLRPSLLSGATRALGSQMSRNALLSQMQGDQFEPLPAPQIPSVTPAPQAGKFDTALNWIGGLGTGLGAVGEAIKRKNPYIVPNIVPKIPDLGPVDPYQLPGYSAGGY